MNTYTVQEEDNIFLKTIEQGKATLISDTSFWQKYPILN